MTGTGKTVTRVDLCEAVYQKVGLSRTESSAFVELVLKEITDCLEKGETVKLSSFGSFMVRKKGQRIGRNPKTGTEVPISPRRVMVFKPSAILKQRINGQRQRRRQQDEHSRQRFRPAQKGVGIWTRRRMRSEPSARSLTDLAFHSTCCGSGRRRFTQIKPMKRAAAGAITVPTTSTCSRASAVCCTARAIPSAACSASSRSTASLGAAPGGWIGGGFLRRDRGGGRPQHPGRRARAGVRHRCR